MELEESMRVLSLSFLSLLSCGSLYGTVYEWTPQQPVTNFVWDFGDNWTPNTGYPGLGVGDTATFDSEQFSSPTLISSALPNALIEIQMSSPSNPITIGSSGGPGISLVQGITLEGSVNLTIACNVSASDISSSLMFDTTTSGGGTLTFNGSLIGNTADIEINPTGAGSLLVVLAGSNSFSQSINLYPTSTLSLNNLGALTGASQCAVDSATLQMGVNLFDISIPVAIQNGSTAVVNTTSFTTTISGDITETGGAGFLSVSGGTLILTGANTFSGGTTVTAGTLQGSVASFPTSITADLGTTVIFNETGGAPVTYASPLAVTGSGALQKTGSNTLIFTGNNEYHGGTTVVQGTLQGTNITIPTNPNLAGLAGPITIDAGANLTFAQTADGEVSSVISGGGSLTSSGAGQTLTLSGVNSYSGGTSITAGTVSISHNLNLGAATAPVTIGAATLELTAVITLTRNFSLTGAATIDATGLADATIEGAITGTGSLTTLGAPLVLSQSTTNPQVNSYTGGTTVTASTSLQGNTNTLQGAIAIGNSATLIFNQTFTGTYGGAATGNGSVTIQGGEVIFSGANTYAGGTDILTGSLQGFTSATPSLQGDIVLSSGTSVIFNQTGIGTYPTGNPGVISGNPGLNGGLVVMGTGTLILSGANTYTGMTTIQSGTLSITNYNQIGSGPLTIATGILNLGSSSINISQTVTLTGAATVDTNANTDTISGLITGNGSLTKTGSGTLILSSASANTYSGGTTVSQGVLQGTVVALEGSISIASGANVTFTGSGTYSGSMYGAGSVTIGTVPSPAGVVVFSGGNSYSGGTLIFNGTLQGTTTSIQGPVTMNAGTSLIFSQSGSGSYAGVLTGSGSLQVTGGGTVTLSGMSPLSFTGTTTLNGANLVVSGSIASSPVTISSGTLSGTGAVGSIVNTAGTIEPGTLGVGTLTANGAVSFGAASFFSASVTPTSGGLLSATGAVTIDPGSKINVTVDAEFFGFTQEYVLINGASVTGEFLTGSLIAPSSFQALVTYTPTQVLLLLQSLTPFLNFPFANANERSVGQNLDAISLSGQISSELFAAIEELAGQSDATIDDALDQMHPAATSAFAQMQVELGAQLLSVLHRRETECGCRKKNQLWVEPFGNWLELKPQGMQIGFSTTTRGVVLGYEREYFDMWTVGFGGSYSATDLQWTLGRGYAFIKSAYGAFYSDLEIDALFLGLSAYGGKDWYDRARHIAFVSVDEQAVSHSSGLDAGAQMHLAYYFKGRNFALYPYATVDYLYLNNEGFSENGSPAFDLEVSMYSSATLRVETGGAFSLVETNRDRTICLSPFLAMGYVWERPLHRSTYRAKFKGTTIPFTTWGWDEVWQLIHLKMGMAIVYRCFTLDSEYVIDLSPDGGSPFVNQRANFRMSYNF